MNFIKLLFAPPDQNAIIGFKLTESPCCSFAMNRTENRSTVNVTDLPHSIMGDKSLLVPELFPTDYNFVSNGSQLLVFVEHK